MLTNLVVALCGLGLGYIIGRCHAYSIFTDWLKGYEARLEAQIAHRKWREANGLIRKAKSGEKTHGL